MNKKFRSIYELKDNWKFTRGEQNQAESPDFNDSNWKTVRVPHDWAIEGPFDKNNDSFYTDLSHQGIEERVKILGRTGGLSVSGNAWYRKKFTISSQDKDKKFYIEFDGIMSNSTVYLNGEKIGGRPYGYSSFSFELTDQIKFSTENVLAVKVAPQPFSSRWYPGAGIYRHVRLVVVNPVHVAGWGTYITTPIVNEDEATVEIRTEVLNRNKSSKDIELRTQLIDNSGKKVASTSNSGNIDKKEIIFQKISVDNPFFWDIDNPYLYRAVSRVLIEGEVVDKYETTFGIRKINFDADKGFFLNGNKVKLKGVCLHHDNGPLGAKVNKRAIERKLELLKTMGCNAIRTSHNPPAPELLDLCDEKGLLVIDEAFDEWKTGKVENGYHKYFDDWAEKDLKSMIKRDRNHPSIIMWSIGNEIHEQKEEKGAEVARFLTEICHDKDSTRPVTAGFNHGKDAIDNGLTREVDIIGWNYMGDTSEIHDKVDFYKKYHQNYPDCIVYGSETESCLSTRGEYYLPVKEEIPAKKHSSLQISSYDFGAARWGYPPEYEFKSQSDHPFVLGEFVWTGFDYLGEPYPYREEWPSRSSYFGILDLCGFPKDRYYLYKSKWSRKPTLHLLPHWNWQGKEGEKIPVFCYTNYNAAELFLNDKSMGVRKKNQDSLFDKYRLRWQNVKYQPGTLKVVVYDDNNQPAMTKEIKTAGLPAKIEMKADRQEIVADGDDLCYITVSITDERGNLCSKADNLISFDVEGPAEIVAVGNGDPTSTEPFVADYRQAFNGLCVVIVRSINNRKGKILINSKSKELKDGMCQIKSKKCNVKE